jgi:glycosyltransferase involved in cell wall biosynthesis
MKILYVATRYHTNQVPVMRGWHEDGANVKFMVQYCGTIESHDYVDLQMMKPSWFSRMLFRMFEKRYNHVRAENLKIKTFVPDLWDIYKTIRKFNPDVVIIRNYRMLGIIVNIACKMLGIKNVVIYTQYPIYGKKNEHGSFVSRIFMSLAPSAVFSPVFYRGEYRTKEIRTGLAKYFIPLICDKPQTVRSEYCPDNKIRLLDIGKYREYKNHFFVVDAMSKVRHPERFELTIIGQLSNEAERKYYDRLERFIKEKHLEDIVHLRGHVDFNEMESVYENHDILLLASKNETAGMVILEAMSKGLCVVSSINCGLTSYLDEYKCGLSFKIKTPDDLIEILNKLEKTPVTIKELGQKAQQVVNDEFCFEKYREGLNGLLQAEYNNSMTV